MSSRAITLLLLLLSACAGAVDVEGVAASSAALTQVGIERSLSTPMASGGRGVGTNPRVASDGTRYLVVFNDSRLDDGDSENDLFAMRMLRDGTREDTFAVLLESLPGNATAPDVAHGGGVFLAAWGQRPSSGSTALRAVRLRPDLSPVDASPLNLGAATTRPRIAFGGGVFGMVWNDGGRIRFVTVPPSGAPSSPVVVCGNGTGSAPSIASDGAGFMVAWRENAALMAGVFTATVTASGVVSAPCGQRVAAGGEAPSLAYGDRYAMAWRAGAGVSAAPLTAAGALGSTVVIAATSASDPDLIQTGSALFVAYNDSSGGTPAAKGQRLTWAVTKTGGILSTGLGALDLAVGSSGQEVFLTSASTQVRAQRLSLAGAVLDAQTLLVSAGPHGQEDAFSVPLGSGALSLWAEFDNETSTEVRGTRLSAAGVPLDDPALSAVVATETQEPRGLAFAASSGNVFALWADQRTGSWDVRGSRISPSGALLDGQTLVLATGTTVNGIGAVSSDGTDYLAVFNAGTAVQGKRVSGAGVVLDATPLALMDAQGTPRRLALAYGAGMYLLGVAVANVDFDARAVRVDPQGVPLDSTFLSLAGGPGHQQLCSVVAVPDGFLAITTDDAAGPAQLSVRKVNLDGSLEPPTPLTSGPESHEAAAAVALDDRILLVWLRKDTAGLTSLWHAELSLTGLPLTAPSELMDAPGTERSPALTRLSSGEALLTYSREASSPSGLRVFARVLTPVGLPLPDGGPPVDGGGGGPSDGGGAGGDADGGMASRPDAGAEPTALGVGCGCGAARASTAWPLALLLALGLKRRSRRDSVEPQQKGFSGSAPPPRRRSRAPCGR